MPGQWPDSKVRSAGRIPTVEPPRSCSLSLSTWSLRVKLFTTWSPGNANMISPTKPACPRTFATTSSTSSAWTNPVRSLSSGNWPVRQATTNSRPSHSIQPRTPSTATARNRTRGKASTKTATAWTYTRSSPSACLIPVCPFLSISQRWNLREAALCLSVLGRYG